MEQEVPESGRGFWEVFKALEGERTYSGGMVPIPSGIPVSAIRAEAAARWLDPDEAVVVVQQLDEAWRLHAMQKAQPPKEKKPAK